MNRNTVKQYVCATLAFGVLATVSSVAFADVTLPYFTGFESDTPGPAALNNPAGWDAPGQPSTDPNYVSGEIGIVSGSSTGGSGANLQVLQYQASFSAPASYWGNTFRFTPVADELLQIEFKVKLGAGSNNTDFKFLGEGPGGQTSYLRMQAGGSLKFSYYDTVFHDLLTGLIQDNWYHVVQTLDLANKTFDITIDNLDSALPSQHGAWTDLGFSPLGGGGASAMGSLNISSVSGVGADLQVDDIGVGVVPEPASLGLMVIGVTLLVSGRRR